VVRQNRNRAPTSKKALSKAHNIWKFYVLCLATILLLIAMFLALIIRFQTTTFDRLPFLLQPLIWVVFATPKWLKCVMLDMWEKMDPLVLDMNKMCRSFCRSERNTK